MSSPHETEIVFSYKEETHSLRFPQIELQHVLTRIKESFAKLPEKISLHIEIENQILPVYNESIFMHYAFYLLARSLAGKIIIKEGEIDQSKKEEYPILDPEISLKIFLERFRRSPDKERKWKIRLDSREEIITTKGIAFSELNSLIAKTFPEVSPLCVVALKVRNDIQLIEKFTYCKMIFSTEFLPDQLLTLHVINMPAETWNRNVDEGLRMAEWMSFGMNYMNDLRNQEQFEDQRLVFHKRIQEGNLEELKKMLSSGEIEENKQWVNEVGSFSQTPFHFFLKKYDNPEIARLFLAYANLQAIDSHGFTPFLTAVVCNRAETAVDIYNKNEERKKVTKEEMIELKNVIYNIRHKYMFNQSISQLSVEELIELAKGLEFFLEAGFELSWSDQKSGPFWVLKLYREMLTCKQAGYLPKSKELLKKNITYYTTLNDIGKYIAFCKMFSLIYLPFFIGVSIFANFFFVGESENDETTCTVGILPFVLFFGLLVIEFCFEIIMGKLIGNPGPLINWKERLFGLIPYDIVEFASGIASRFDLFCDLTFIANVLFCEKRYSFGVPFLVFFLISNLLQVGYLLYVLIKNKFRMREGSCFIELSLANDFYFVSKKMSEKTSLVHENKMYKNYMGIWRCLLEDIPQTTIQIIYTIGFQIISPYLIIKTIIGLALSIHGGIAGFSYLKILKKRWAQHPKEMEEKLTTIHNLNEIAAAREEIIAVAELRFGKNNDFSAWQHFCLANVYSDLKINEKSKNASKAAIKMYKELYGAENEQVRLCYNNLIFFYNDLNDHRRAIKCAEKALKMQIKLFGEVHENTSFAYNNAGFAYKFAGEFQKAANYFHKAYNIEILLKGENSDLMVDIYSNLGTAYNELNQHDTSQDYFRKAIKTAEKVLGKNNEKTIMLRSALDDAELPELKIEDLHEIGANTSTLLLSHAMKLSEIGEKEKAIEFVGRAIEMSIQMKGENSQDTATAYMCLASIFMSNKEEEKTMEAFSKMERILKALPQKDYAIEAQVHLGRANVHRFCARKNEIISEAKLTVETLKKMPNPIEPEIARIFYTVASMLANLGKWGDACETIGEAIKKREAGERKDEIDEKLSSTFELVKLKVDKKEETVLEAKTDEMPEDISLNKGDLAFGIMFEERADLMKKESKNDEAIELYKKALDMCSSETQGVRIVNILTNLGDLFEKRGEIEQAMQCLSAAMDNEKKLSGSAPTSTYALLLLKSGLLLEKTGDFELAFNILKSAILTALQTDIEPLQIILAGERAIAISEAHNINFEEKESIAGLVQKMKEEYT